MKTGPATNSTIKFVCEKCGQLNEIEGSYNPVTFTLRLRYAECKHCGHPRQETTVPSGYFKCGECHVVYKRFKHWRPAKGKCLTCYMRLWRKKQKKG